MRRLAVLILCISASVSLPVRAAATRDESAWDKSSPCIQNQQKIVAACFTFHGRAQQGNGTPSKRIWRVHTTRMYGVDDERFPDNVEVFLQSRGEHQDVFDNVVYGDFLVCPYQKSIPGHMQAICVAGARNLNHVIRKD